MTIIQALVLGIIQGLTEFLPVSSSGHLIFIPKIFGWPNQGTDFDVIIHLGTLLALVIYFRKKLWFLLKAFFSKSSETKQNRKLVWLIILTVLPAGVVGLFLGDKIEKLYSGSALIIGISFIVWGIILGLADKYSAKFANVNSLSQLNWKKSLVVGLAQAVALIPGTSRSGITMTAGMFCKLDKKTAAEFSFLISVPIVALAGLSGLWHLSKTGFETVGLLPLSIGFMASAISGLFAVWSLLKILEKWSFRPFVIYRIIIGLIILFLL